MLKLDNAKVMQNERVQEARRRVYDPEAIDADQPRSAVRIHRVYHLRWSINQRN